MCECENGHLLVVWPDGSLAKVPNSYDGIKRGLDGGTLDFVKLDPDLGFYVDDEGIIKALQLNIPASILAQRALYGPVVVCRGEPNDEGDTVEAEEGIIAGVMMMAHAWKRVRFAGLRSGQDIQAPRADPDRLTAAHVQEIPDGMSLEEFFAKVADDYQREEDEFLNTNPDL